MSKKKIVACCHEFTIDLLDAIPYAYYLYRKGELLGTIGCRDTKCFYFFSPNHKEVFKNRHIEMCMTEAERKRNHYWGIDIHPVDFTGFPEEWKMPDYKEMYQNDIFVFDKPILVISNKVTTEWSGPPVNFFDVRALNDLANMLCPYYQIIYNRPDDKLIVADDGFYFDIGDKKMFKERFPNVILMEDLLSKGFSFNETQLMVYANCSRFISTLGGNSMLCMLFGGTNVIYIAKGTNFIDNNGYNTWLRNISGQLIIPIVDPLKKIVGIDKWKYPKGEGGIANKRNYEEFISEVIHQFLGNTHG